MKIQPKNGWLQLEKEWTEAEKLSFSYTGVAPPLARVDTFLIKAVPCDNQGEYTVGDTVLATTHTIEAIIVDEETSIYFAKKRDVVAVLEESDE